MKIFCSNSNLDFITHNKVNNFFSNKSSWWPYLTRFSCQNNAGQTPLDVAELCNQKECANYLRQMQMLQYKRGLLQRNEIYVGTKEAGVFSCTYKNIFPHRFVSKNFLFQLVFMLFSGINLISSFSFFKTVYYEFKM